MKLAIISGIIFTLLLSNSYAVSDKVIFETCFDLGLERIELNAVAQQCEIDLRTISAEAIDNRWYDPSAFIWYHADGECNDGSGISTVVQYYGGRCY